MLELLTWTVAVLLVSTALPCLTHAQTVDLVLIEKGVRRLTLKREGKEVAVFKVALGGTPQGPKECQGDAKTPEGDYQISGRNPHSAFHKSLRISYPSKSDRIRAAALGCSPGGDIMIHGLPNGRGWVGASHSLTDWTNGCVAVTDSEIDQIWKLVPDGVTVRIVP